MWNKVVRGILGFFPCVMVLVIYFIYIYGSVNSNTEIGEIILSMSSGYDNIIEAFSFSNNQKYLESVDIIEKEDVVRIEEEKAALEFMNKQKGIADLNSWVLPIVGNYVITTYYSSYHRAIDYYSYDGYGSAILAVNNGTIYSVNGGCVSGNLSCNGGRGNFVVINHNNGNYYSMYMHLDKINVSVGDIVSASDVIGTMGNTGYVIPTPTSYNPFGGTHLHFEVYIGIPDSGGYEINPLSLY